MPGVKGQITKSVKGKQTSVYLSDALRVFMDRGRLHITSGFKRQPFHINVSKRDGLLFDSLLLLYHHGLAVGTEEPAGPMQTTE
jgi:hypothetical protein